MIWFACAQCGKRHGRPESAIGSILFCECGHGNRVPWESTAPPPDPDEEPVVVLPSGPPPLEAVPVGEERMPPPRPAPRTRGRRDPAFCFNHRDLVSEVVCEACTERFCGRCVV